jgi:hypothetical protein
VFLAYNLRRNTNYMSFRDQPFNFKMGEGAMLFSVQNFFRTTRVRIFFLLQNLTLGPKNIYICFLPNVAGKKNSDFGGEKKNLIQCFWHIT